MQYFNNIASLSGLKRTSGLDWYFKGQIFKGVDLKNKRMLDIGGGNGLASIRSLMQGGLKEATVLDPFDSGSNSDMLEQFQKMKYASGVGDRLKLHIGTLKDLSVKDGIFDIALMHNSVNHINEEMIPLLKFSLKARNTFLEEFKSIRSRIALNGTLIVSDCSNRNFFGDMGIKNPIAPTINWAIHQSPAVWSAIIQSSEFKHARTTWTTRRELGRFGHFILGNKVGAYLTSSHFTLVFKAVNL
jgi:hypothetical protein